MSPIFVSGVAHIKLLINSFKYLIFFAAFVYLVADLIDWL